MRKLLFAVFAALLASPLPVAALFITHAGANSTQEQGNENQRVMAMPQRERRRRVRGDRRRIRHRGIRSAFKKAGKSAGRGGKGFGQNVARGRVVRGGKEFGKGMGGFGKHTGKGIGRTMRRVFKP
jgi:hypothetical protein